MIKKAKWLRRLLWIPIMLIVLLATGVGAVEAADGMRGTNCAIERDEVIDHDFYFLCYNLTIRGTVNGDLIGTASRVTVVRGAAVNGDIWIAAGQLIVEGTVEDDMHFAGGNFQVTKDAAFPEPRIDIAALAISVSLEEGVTLPGDLLMLGYQGIVDGDVGSNIDFQGQTLRINGNVAGNVDAIVGDRRQETPLRTFPLPFSISLTNPGFFIGETSVINGNLTYEAPQQVVLGRNTVRGRVNYTRSLQQVDITRVEQSETFFTILRSYVVGVLQDALSLMIVGLFMLQFLPMLMIEPGKRVQRTTPTAFSWGFMLFILNFPIGFALLIFSVVLVILVTVVTLGSLTVPASLFFLVVNVVLIGGFWFLLLFVGPAITSFVVGVNLVRVGHRWYAERNRDPDEPVVYLPIVTGKYRWLALAVGVAFFSLLVNAPLPASNFIQIILWGAFAFVGLGAVFMYGRDIWHLTRSGWLTADLTTDRLDAMPLDTDVPLGLENLPDGFNGFAE
ncbi:MAG: polymer-forming cytoskeletal protein [Chloroflexi bacterium]|nr:polymer-forming cytoskeletal protein [Chloroflexota bacterium]